MILTMRDAGYRGESVDDDSRSAVGIADETEDEEVDGHLDGPYGKIRK
jgi:hypothetical protein